MAKQTDPRQQEQESDDPLHVFAPKDAFEEVVATKDTSPLCLVHIVDSVPEDVRQGHYALIAGYTRENEPKALYDGFLAILLAEGDEAAAMRLGTRILAIFENLHLESTLCILTLREARSFLDTEESAWRDRLREQEPGSVLSLPARD